MSALSSRHELECAITDLEGDELLLTLALEELFERCAPATGMIPGGEGYVWICATKDQARAVTHAAMRVGDGVRSVSRIFYGLEEKS